MKYIVIKIYNTEIDSCSHNEAGVAACSTWTGGPYVEQASRPFETGAEAYKEMKKIIESELNAWENIGCNDGWQFAFDPGNPIGYIHVNNGQNDGEYKEYWLEAFDILKIEEVFA